MKCNSSTGERMKRLPIYVYLYHSIVSLSVGCTAYAEDNTRRKVFCTPTHQIVCVNKDVPLYKEGCQIEVGLEGTLSIMLDLDRSQSTHCWQSDGECYDGEITVEETDGDYYITRNASASADRRDHGVLNLRSMSYAETNTGGATNGSLIVSVSFYHCQPLN